MLVDVARAETTDAGEVGEECRYRRRLSDADS